jgi:PKD repeat protein
VIVRGTVSTSATEVSIKVNGVIAEVYGNQFVANNVPLMEGSNTIIANALDSNGAVARTEVNVTATTTGPYITLSANITSGIPTLTTYFSVLTAIPNTIITYQIDFEGDGIIDYTGDTFDNISHTYTTEGIYYPTVTVTDDQGNTYTDTIAITVVNKAAIDALLKGKWEGMKEALASRDIEKAASYFFRTAQEKYRNIFTTIMNRLPSIAANMQAIEMIYLEDGVAQYRIKRLEEVGVVTYYVYLALDENGMWKIQQF